MLQKSYYLIVVAILASFTFYSCNSKEEKLDVDPAFGEYISGFTSGIISSKDPIVIRLSEPYQGQLDMNEALSNDLFNFSPSINGEAFFKDEYTIHFIPSKPLESGEIYDGDFYLSQILDVPNAFKKFPMRFQIIAQNYEVYVYGQEPYDKTDLTNLQIKGSLNTADFADSADVKEVLKAFQNGEERTISWQLLDGTKYDFTIENVVRSEEEQEVLLQYNGASLGIDKSGEQKVEIPSLNDFKVLGVTVHRTPEQYIEIQFSDPLAKQLFDGIVTLSNTNDLTFVSDGNSLKVYSDSRIAGTRTIRVDAAIQNLAERKMGKPYTAQLLFEQEKPQVRLVGNKIILPNSDGLIMPFEAVGLNSVDVYVYKVFTNNILQYLQTNNLGGEYQLNRVGRNIYRKKINLNEAADANLAQWHRYYVDLSDVIKKDPSAIYQVEIRFKKAYSSYICDDDEDDNKAPLTSVNEVQDGWIGDGESLYYDNYYDYYYYDWEHREDPCHQAYYSRYNTRVSKTVMASDLGVIAKMGGNNEMLVVVNDMLTTNPVSGAEVIVYDYQQQIISTSTTGGDGMIKIKLNREPFVVEVSYQDQKNYLKVERGNSLSLSKFDITGSTVRDGLKGYLYGERGVWRPGDSLYLTFVLQDQEALLPANHPIILEIKNPRGQMVKRLVKTTNINGFYDFRTATNAEDPTGIYQATVRVGNRNFYKNLRIETVKPNRLKINLDFNGEEIFQADELNGNLEAKWLHGAIAKNLKAKVDMVLSASRTTFKTYKNYHFDNNIQKNFYTDETTVFEGKTDEDGKAELNIEIPSYQSSAPGKLRAAFNTKVFEPGGNFSVDYQTITYSPYSAYVGMLVPEGKMWGGALETGQKHTVQVVVLDDKGKKTTRNELNFELYRLHRRWWYDRYSGSNYNHLSSSSYTKVKDDVIKPVNGEGSIDITIPKDNWGRYLIKVTDPVSGHSTAQLIYFDWPYWMRANRTDSEASTMLGFSSNKENYQVGENIEITFPSPANGRALVCLENGTKVLQSFWVKTEEGETKVEITADENMAPNVFANIMLVQPHGQTENDRPIRMFGVIPILVENGETHLEPELDAPEVIRPESTVDFKVSESNGRAMAYTLAIVDEGLLDLTRFKTPDLWNHFYAREALGVNTWDMYDLVMGAFGEQIGSILSIGGDGSNADADKQKAMRFKPLVRFEGPFYLEEGESKTHQIEIPNYIGSVRAMVVAGQDAAYGKTEKAIPVRKPLMVTGTLPRVLGPGETVKLPANVFAMEKHVKDVKLTLETNELLSIVGEKTKSMRFDKVGDEVIFFDLKVAKDVGIARAKLTATSGNEKSVYEIELDVRSPNPSYSIITDTLLQPGEVWNTSVDYFGISNTNIAAVELSVLPALNLEDRLGYLIRYPHGCIEQTTSSAFPQLYLEELIELSGEQKQKRDYYINATLEKYRNFQVASGGLGYWPGSAHASDWGSNYAGHFMLEAEAKGYLLPAGLKSQWLKYQRSSSRTWSANSDRMRSYAQRIQAYRLYTLALAGSPELGAMNLLKGQENLDLSSTWILALAYTEAGQIEVAKKLIENVDDRIPQYVELSYSYGSNLRDEAFILKTLLAIGKDTDAARLAISMAEALGNKKYMSTQTTAFCLMGVAEYSGDQMKGNGIQADIAFNGKNKSYATQLSMIQTKHSPGASINAIDLAVKNTSNSKLFARLITTGQPLEGREKRIQKNLDMKVNYLDLEGNEIDVSQLSQGTDFVAEVQIYNPGTRGYYQEMALTQVFPSGWEILNDRMMAGPNVQQASVPVYQDIRDDRVLTYYNISSRRYQTYRVRLNATYLGRYYLPAVLSNAMYDDEIMAVQPGKWVEVVADDNE